MATTGNDHKIKATSLHFVDSVTENHVNAYIYIYICIDVVLCY